MKKGNILLVDDDRLMRKNIPRILYNTGFEITSCKSGEQAIREIQNGVYDLVLTDIKMPEMDGISLLKYLKKEYPDLPVVLFTGHGTIESAVSAIKEGAEDYITKPFTEDELIIPIERVLEKKRILEENRRLQQELASKYQMGSIIGTSPVMKDIFSLVLKAAKSMANVAIYGETGTGKELVARAIHHNSPRSEEPFIALNCGSFPETLLESELFGYTKGAFTGATKDKVGFFEAADGGTLFLDEIGDLSKAMQVKFLRVIEERHVIPLGDTNPIKVNVRLITATNRDLGNMIKEGDFRKDLFYRLHVIPIYLPPLRRRMGDIHLLVEYFIEKYNKEENKSIRGFSAESLDLLLSYDWPGNVRELENLVQRSIALSEESIISHSQLPPQFTQNKRKGPVNAEDFGSLADIEREHLLKVLEACGRNRSRTSEILGIHRNTLYGKMKKLGL